MKEEVIRCVLKCHRLLLIVCMLYCIGADVFLFHLRAGSPLEVIGDISSRTTQPPSTILA